MTRTQLASIAVSVGILVTLTIADNREDALQHKQYCEMVEIHEQSGGEYGWPPFKGAEKCNQPTAATRKAN